MDDKDHSLLFCALTRLKLQTYFVHGQNYGPLLFMVHNVGNRCYGFFVVSTKQKEPFMNEDLFPNQPDYGEPEDETTALEEVLFGEDDKKKRTFGGQKAPRFVRPPFFKVGNKDPQGKSTLIVGQLYEVIKGEEPKPHKSVACSLVYASDIRTLAPWKGGDLNILCQSHNGTNPSARITMPFCLKGDAAHIGQVLKDRNFTDVQIKGLIPQLIDDKGRLRQCSYTTDSGFQVPLCPKAMKDELGAKAPCVPKMRCVFFSHDEQRLFIMELKGQDLFGGKAFVSPFKEFQKWVQAKGIDYPYVHITLSGGVGPGGFGITKFDDLFIIEDTTLRHQMDEAYKKFEKEQIEGQSYIPKPKEDNHEKG